MHRNLVKKHWKLLQMVHPGGKELKSKRANDHGQMMLDTQAMPAMSRMRLGN